MAEVKIALLPTGMTYSRNTKAPLEDKRIFDTLALAQEYINNVDQTAYVGLTISVVNDDANNGLYYVERIADANNATGLLVKVGSDAAEDVANLKSDVATLKGTVGDSTSGLVADVAGKADAFTAGDGIDYTDNVVKVSISATEGNSLSVKSDGLYVAVPEIEVPEYTLESVSNNDSLYASQYQLKKDGVAVGATINIPKDQFLKDASFHATAEDGVSVEAPYLKFVWDLDINEDLEGIQNVTYVPVKDLVDTYTAGEYITISEGEIAVNYVSLTHDLRTTLGIKDITDNISTLQTTVGNSESGLVANVAKNTSEISQIQGSMETLRANISDTNTDLATFKSSVKVTDIDDTASHGVSLGFTEAAEGETSSTIKVNVDLEALRADLSVNANTVLTTADIKDNEDDVDVRYEQGTSVQSILANLNSRINEIDSDIQGALAGGVTNVGAGNGISVDSSTATKPVVSVKVVAGSALKATTDGLDIY